MVQRKVFLGFCLLVMFSAKSVLAQTNPKTTKVIRAVQIEEDFEITGTLNQPPWQQADVAYIAYEIQPNDDAPAPVKTEVRVLYSNDYLYVGFKAYDPDPEKIRASITERDEIFGQDCVAIMLDTFGNRLQVYEFFVTPLGIQTDAYRTTSSREDRSFNALWFSAGTITDFGYTAVMKIPFKSLNFPEKKIQDWTVQFFRNYPRSVRHQLVWTDANKEESCFLCQNGELANIRGIEAENTIEFLPYLAGFQSSTLNESGNLSSGLNHEPIQIRAGGSISYAPTSTMSIDAVINPDFSQVESDEVQIGVNETFALFYPEKRPFFLKDAALFDTPGEGFGGQKALFYSRSINNPLLAGKFTQKTAGYSIAFLTALDENTPFIVPGTYGSAFINSGVNSYSNILRGRYNFGAETYVGGLATARNQPEGANYVGSIDWQIRLSENYYFDGQVAYSYTDEPGDTTLFNGLRKFGKSSYNAAFNGEQYGGTFISAGFERKGKYYNGSIEYTAYSPTFQAHNGFINQVNSRSYSTDHDLSYYPNTEWFSEGSLSVFGSWNYDFSGRFQERFMNIRLSNRFAGQTRLTLSYLPVNDERFRGRMFMGLHRWSIRLNTHPIEALELGGDVNSGHFVYRSAQPVEGKGYEISFSATLKPGNHLTLDFMYDYSTLSSLNGSQQFYSGNIVRFTGRYYFSRELFFRLITQYNSFNNQIQIYPLLYYQLNPFTRFYIGMTDYLRQPAMANSFNQYKQVNRQFFVKFQYLFRY